MQRLELIDGQADPARISLVDEILIGRGKEASLRIFDETASRRHCVVVADEARTILRDLGSANGTQLNGEPVDGEAVLFDGDVIEVGDVRLRFYSGDGSNRDTVVPLGTGDEIEAAVDPDNADPFVEGAGHHAMRRLRLVCEAAVACADASDVDSLPGDLIGLIQETFSPDRATVCLREPEDRMRVAAAVPENASPPASRMLRERVLDRGEAVLIRDAEESEGAASASMVRSRYRSTMAAPLKTAEGILGFVSVEAIEPGTYGPGDLRALAAVARQAALALRTLRELSGARQLVQHLSRERATGAPVILGESPRIVELRQQITKAAEADSPVLVMGETGTGKELVARRLHAEGPRRDRPFVALNCAALVEGLLESELFGHEKGAFTDAREQRDGRIAEAADGTLFLDEVGDLSLTLQAKLLRVLSEKTFRRLGGSESFEMRCRVIAATNRGLKKMVEESTFREDLYYRLAVVVLRSPPLRERPGDIALLAEAGLERLAARLGKRVPRIDEDARETIAAYRWPGNIRELFNVLERALVLLEGETLTSADLPREVRDPESRPIDVERIAGELGLLGDGVFDLKEIERLAVKAALEKTGGKKGEAARLLGVSWPTLNRKIRQYGL